MFRFRLETRAIRLFAQKDAHFCRRGTATATAATSSVRGSAAQAQAGTVEKQREQRILHVVEQKVAYKHRLERESANQELQAGLSHHEQIKRSKTLKELQPLVEAWTEWTRAREAREAASALLNDPDPSMRTLASDEYEQLCATMATLLDSTFPKLLIPPSPTSNVSAILELKAGAGGDEAALFAGDLLRMYQRYAQVRGDELSSRTRSDTEGRGCGLGGWTANVMSQNELTIGKGVKEAIIEIKGLGSYDSLRWETGVHRVQRVPATESGGRLHTSAVAVAVFPMLEDNQGEMDESTFQIDETEVKVEVMRSRGAGGQHVNKTESAVRLTHIPTGITVSMQDSRSQHQNKASAWRILRARLYDRKLNEEAIKRRAMRKSLMKGTDRSDKIRTYNYVQDRVTDHRIGFTTMNLQNVMDGERLESIIEALRKQHEVETIQELLEDADNEGPS